MTLGTASAETLTVNNSTGMAADYISIQAAVNASTDGDTIIVYPGSYEENINADKANITIISQSGNPANTTVMAVDPDDYVFHVDADNVKHKRIQYHWRK
ncbi:MAG: hypothetical protein R2741_13040 [Methanolobus sp.]